MSSIDRLNTPEVLQKKRANWRSETERRQELLEDRTPARHKSPAHSGKFTPERQAIFLFMLAETGQRVKSARLAGVGVSAVYYRTNPQSQGYNPDFAEAMEEAEEIYNEMLDETIAERGISGWKEPVFGGKDRDKIVGYIRKFDNKLLLEHAKSRMAKYRDKVTVTQETKSTAGPMEDKLANLTRDQRKALRGFLETMEPGSTQEPDVIDAEVVEVDPQLETMIEDI